MLGSGLQVHVLYSFKDSALSFFVLQRGLRIEDEVQGVQDLDFFEVTPSGSRLQEVGFIV